MILTVCLLRYSNQLNVEDERGATRNAGLGVFAVAHLCRNVKLPLVTNVHLLQGDDPTVNQVAESHGNRCAANARIELLAVDGPAGIVDGDDASLLRLSTIRVARLQDFVIDAFRESFHTLLLGRLAMMYSRLDILIAIWVYLLTSNKVYFL